jgi:hypothetical protein
VSNDACFTGANWEPYTADKTWTLSGEPGWNPVYVKTSDSFSRTLTVSDTIYLGQQAPLDELGDSQMSTTQPQVTLYHLDGGGLPQVQFSLGWLADDSFDTFKKLWGNGKQVNDPAAWGGTAYQLNAGPSEASAWVWDTTFIKDVPMTAYFRLKVDQNNSSDEVARIAVTGGNVQYGPLSLHGTDFDAPGEYQEFPLNFTFNSDPEDVFLIFQVWRSGSADVTFDAVSIFSAPQALTSPFSWSVPGGNYRGQGVWVRYTDGSQFSDIQEATTHPASLSVAPKVLSFLAARHGRPPPTSILKVNQGCAGFGWQVSQDASWLKTQVSGHKVLVGVETDGLQDGAYTGTVTITPTGSTGVPPVSIPVHLTVVEQELSTYLPFVRMPQAGGP